MKKGFTLIELLAVIVILAIIALIATPLIMDVIEQSKKGAFESAAYGIVEAGELGYAQDVLEGQVGEVTFTYTNGEVTSEPSGRSLDLKGTKPQNGQVKVNSNGEVALAIHDGTNCAQKGFTESEVTVSGKVLEECTIPGEQSTPSYTYYDESEGVNAPVLATGMTPIVWNGTSWDTTNSDAPNWYDYSNKQWANAQTKDGSFWVWIPRYAYQIASGYHTSTAGTINIKFLIDDTDTTSDETVIAQTPTYSGDAQTNYVSHPAFTFGTDEVPGIWVAKFEPSNDGSDNVKVVPNVSSWRSISIGDAFDTTITMKDNKSTYGWNNTEVVTHLMKNSEWGAVAYLSQSLYGKETEIWINPNSNYTTGCAGDAVDNASTTSCNTYESTNGVKASTTGTVYGVYDMSGGAYEMTSAYVNNGDSNLTTYGNSIINADSKHKDIYDMGANDTRVDNYAANANVFGDAVYETSSSGENNASWNGDYSYIPCTSNPWFMRGRHYAGEAGAGAFTFGNANGGSNSLLSFRPVVLPVGQ